MPSGQVQGGPKEFVIQLGIEGSNEITLSYDEKRGLRWTEHRLYGSSALCLHLTRRVLYQCLTQGCVPREQVLSLLSEVRNVTPSDRRHRVEELWDAYCTGEPEGRPDLNIAVKEILAKTSECVST